MGLRYRWLKDHESSETYRYDVVYAWLERQDWVAEMCPPTWQNIVTTLRELDHYGVAEKMSKGRGMFIAFMCLIHPITVLGCGSGLSFALSA